MSTHPMTANLSEESAWAPLRNTLFKWLWIATVASNIGTWVQDVGSSWLMATLDPSPLMVSLVQTATTLPMFLLALPAGALADVVDRRKLLLFSQAWMFMATLCLAILTWSGHVTPGLLLAFTFLLGIGTALNMPAWQAVIPEVVSKEELRGAVTLQGVGMNVARAVGPALGGFIVASFGIAATFLLNAISFLGVIVVLFTWKRAVEKSPLPTERFLGAMKLGFRYVQHAPALQAVLIRSGSFIFFGVSLFSLLPILVKSELKLGPSSLGILLGFLGAGAVIGATFLAKLKKKLSTDALVVLAILLFTALLVSLAFVSQFVLLCAAMFAGGVAWIAILSSLNLAAQSVAPGWIKARALSMYLLVFYGSMAFGSLTWGSVASSWGLKNAFLLASAGMVIGLLTMTKYKLKITEGINLAPSLHWPAPVVAREPEPDQGPVLVQIEYQVNREQSQAFLQTLKKLHLSRMRGGAIRWEVYEDVASPGRFIEEFVVESWIEHLRQHERLTQSDQDKQEALSQYLQAGTTPQVSHWIYSKET